MIKIVIKGILILMKDKENNDDNFNGKILKTSYNEISGFGIDNNLKSNININRVHTIGNEDKKMILIIMIIKKMIILMRIFLFFKFFLLFVDIIFYFFNWLLLNKYLTYF